MVVARDISDISIIREKYYLKGNIIYEKRIYRKRTQNIGVLGT